MTDVLEDVGIDFAAWEDEFEDISCQSVLHAAKGAPPHPANWYATSPCGGIIAVCEARRLQAHRQGGWRCTPERGGCTAFHDYNQIQFHPVKG